MLFLTASSIGILAGMTRSTALITLVALMIAATFGIAAFIGPVTCVDLLAAILGYNSGLFALVVGMTLFSRQRSA